MLSNKSTFESVGPYSDYESRDKMEGKNSTKSELHFYTSPWWQSDDKECDSSEIKSHPKHDFAKLEYESDDSQNTSYSESVEDFAALPVQFRPKKCHRNPTHVIGNHTKTNSFSVTKCEEKSVNLVKRERVKSRDNVGEPKHTFKAKGTVPYRSPLWNSNYNHNDDSKSNAVRLENEEQASIPSVSTNSSNRTTETKKVTFDPRLEAEMRSTDSSIKLEKKSVRKGPSFRSDLSEVSFETLHLSDEIKTNKPIWDSNLAFYKEKSQIWKLNGSSPQKQTPYDGKPLTPEVDTEAKETCKVKEIKSKGIGNGHKKAVGAGNRRTIAWDDNMCSLKSNKKKVNFQYISKEVKDGSSTFTACWGNMHESEIRVNPRRSYSGSRRNEAKKQNSESVGENKITKKQVESETKKSTYRYTKAKGKGMNANRSKKSKTTVIRHEIKVIHVNEPNSSATEKTKDPSSVVLKEQDDLFLKSIISKSVGNTIFKFGMNANSDETELIPDHSSAKKQQAVHSPSMPPDVQEQNVLLKTQNVREMVFSEVALNISKDDIAHKRSTLIQYGKEMSDLIVGSHVFMMTLLSFYDTWLPLRHKTICLLEQLADNISNLNRRDKKIKDVTDYIESGTKLAAVVPDVRIAVVGKIIATISSIFNKLFRSSPSLEHSGVKESEMMRYLQEDIEATSDVYMHGIQCDRQFQEICKLIEEFQHFIDNGNLTAFIEGPEANFIQEMLHFSPSSYIVYYRKLFKCFEKLKDRQTSDISRAFCRAFEFSPEAMAAINQLHWRFHAQVTNSEDSQRAWEEVCMLLVSSNSNTEILLKIRECIRILIKERNAMEKNIAELIKYKI